MNHRIKGLLGKLNWQIFLAICLLMGGVSRVLGFGPAESRSLPCSGVSRRVNAFSSGSSLGELSLIARVKFISHKRVSNAASVLCGARPGNNKRNPDFSNRNRNWEDDRDNYDRGPDESDILNSKNGSQPNAAPDQSVKDIVQLFMDVQPMLRCNRTIGKDVSSSGEGKDNKKVIELFEESFSSSSIRKGSKKIRASENGSAAYGQKATGGTHSEGSVWNRSIPKKQETISTPEPKATPVGRPKSSFQRRSPVPPVKYQPVYNSEDVDSDLGEMQQPELDEESDSDEEFESEQDLEPGPISSFDESIFSDMATGEHSKEENSLDEGDQQPTEHVDVGSLKVAELRELAKSRGMKGYSKLKKSELVEFLSGN